MYLPKLFVILIGALIANHVLAAGLTDGFRGFRWGSEPTSSMSKVSPKANMQGYMARDEDKTVLGVQADSITYYYLSGGLCRVEVAWWPRDLATLDSIQSGLEKHWGKPVKRDGSGGTRIVNWVSESGVTSGALLAMDDATEAKRWHITIIIEGRQCSRAAIEGSGL